MNFARLVGFGSLAVVAGLGIAGMSAGGCSSDDTPPATPGTGGSGGSGDAGMDTAKADVVKMDVTREPIVLSDDYSLTACPGVEPMAPDAGSVGIVTLMTCDDICGGGICVPASTPGVNVAAVPSCPDDGTAAHAKGKCLPEKIIELNGQWVAKKCHADITGGVQNLDGACLPYCFVSAFTQYLSQKECGAGELCAPCIDQMTMMPGGACDNRCVGDAGSEAGSGEASTSDAPTSDATTSDATTTTDATSAGDGPTE